MSSIQTQNFGTIRTNKILMILVLISTFSNLISLGQADITNAHLSLPNRDVGRSAERLLGVLPVLPYPYFQKPKYRYPVYDRNGRGQLLYGYGGPETYQYREFTPIEGHH